MKVLLVDDDPVQLQLATVALRFAGFTPVTASSGGEALALLSREPCDVALLDHDMPGMTGLQVIVELKSRKLLDRMPVIFVTSRDDAAVIDRAFELGASGFVTKPVNWTLMPHQIRFTARAAENERNAAAARDEAVKLASTKNQLLNVVRHELRTPLSAVVGFGRLIRDGIPDDHPLSASTKQMLEGAEQLQARISEMVMCLDLESGRVEANRGEEDAVSVMDELLQKWRQPLLQRGLALVVEPIASEARIKVDLVHLAAMLDRLIGNALAHGGSAQTIRVRTENDDDDEMVRISVIDDGAGIAPERLSDCRSAFQQQDVGPARAREGLGLGLYVVEKLAQLNGGRFSIMSEGVGRGTCASIFLPRS